MFKLIILILASDSEYYIKMQNLWKKYMNNYDNVKSYFIKYDEHMSKDIFITEDTIYIKGYESFVPGCLDKTIKSIEHLIANYHFDFIFRTNMSSVVDIKKLYSILNSDIEAGGIIGIHDNNAFISGAGMLFNKKTCEFIINNKKHLNYNIIDDVSIGLLLNTYKINMSLLTRFEAYNYENNIELIDKETINNYYHFRCKSGCDPNKTIELMNKIIQLILA